MNAGSEDSYLLVTITKESVLTRTIRNIDKNCDSLTPGMESVLHACFSDKNYNELLAALIRASWPRLDKEDSEILAMRLLAHGKATFPYWFSPTVCEWFWSSSSITEDPDHPRIEPLAPHAGSCGDGLFQGNFQS